VQLAQIEGGERNTVPTGKNWGVWVLFGRLQTYFSGRGRAAAKRSIYGTLHLCGGGHFLKTHEGHSRASLWHRMGKRGGEGDGREVVLLGGGGYKRRAYVIGGCGGE